MSELVQVRPPRVQRKWGRAARWWQGMTGWLRNKDGKISRIAVLAYVMLFFFMTAAVTWDKWSFLAFATPGALLVANAIAEKIPLADMLDAMRAGSTAKIVDRLRGVVATPGTVITEASDSKTKTVVTTPAPLPPEGGVTE